MQEFAIHLNKKDPKQPLFIMDSLSEEIMEDFIVRKEQLEASGSPKDILKQHRMVQGEYGISASINGQSVIFAGILPMWPEVAELWCLFPEDITSLSRKNPRQFIHIIKNYINLVPQKRIQTIVKADFKIAIKFIERFGFKNEGLMKKYGPDGQDYYRYAHIKEDN